MHKAEMNSTQAMFAADLASRIRTGMDSVLLQPKAHNNRDTKQLVVDAIVKTLAPLVREASKASVPKSNVTVNEDTDVKGLYHFRYTLQVALPARHTSVKVCKPADMSDTAWQNLLRDMSDFVDKLNSMSEAEYEAFMASTECAT